MHLLMIEISGENGGGEKLVFYLSLHLYFLPLFWIPYPALPCSPKARVSRPPTWAVLCLWRLPGWRQCNEAPARRGAGYPDFGQISSCPRRKFFRISQLILWSSPEEHPLLLLRERKISIWLNLLVEMLLGKSPGLKSSVEKLLVFT